MELLIPGKKVNMVFSVCHIRKFAETTECLLDEIIVFVNKIVKIVHVCGQRWDGIPTNNNGERYLLSWKLPTQADLSKKLVRGQTRRGSDSGEGDASQVVPEVKVVQPYAPLMKEADEVEDFEDLREQDFQRYRE